MNYRIGLDIGITSVGWAVLSHDSNEEANRIVDLGVRTFDRAEVPDTGASLASERREARGTRRRLRRRRHRLDRVKKLFEDEGLISISNLESMFKTSKHANVYKIRYEALNGIINNEELAAILYHFAKHRGFKSNRKSEANNKEEGKLLKATNENKELLINSGYQTVGHMLYKDSKFRAKDWNGNEILMTRNKTDDYKNTILRDLLEEEIKIIFNKQREFGNRYTTKEFEHKYLEIFKSQRSFDQGPGNMPNGQPSPYGGNIIEKMLGKCTFEKDEERACRATYSFEYFCLLQGINNLKIIMPDTSIRRLTEDERRKLIELAFKSSSIDYSKLRSTIGLEEGSFFKNLDYGNKSINDVEKKAKFNYLKAYHEIRKKVEKVDKEIFQTFDINIIDYIARTLTVYKNDNTRILKLKEVNLSNEIIDELLNLNFSKTGNLSIKAIRKIIPFLEDGFIYNEACEMAGYDFKGSISGQKKKLLNTDILKDITNPVVCRAISQSIKVLNAIIRKYGSPQLICIELAREMSKNFEERKKIEKSMKENSEVNDKAKEYIKSLGVVSPTGHDIVKYKLWKEQNEICAYSGRHISVKDLFDKSVVDIDHIIPYSICFDDSYKNKVLVYADENRQKGNRLPYEYFGHDLEKWHKFEVFVNNIKDHKKRQRLLKQKLSKEEIEAFKERNLQDTKYITTQFYNYIRANLEFAESKKYSKRNVITVNGSITSYLRKNWGLIKMREENDKHHALDAVVVACTTSSMIQKISKYVKGRELKYSRFSEYQDKETGEILDLTKLSREEFDEIFGVKFPEPWYNFRKELEIRLSDRPYLYKDILYKLGYRDEEIKPIFVSRAPKRSVTGPAHLDTVRSPKLIDQGYVISKKNLKDLKWDKKNNEIIGYYNKKDDRLLYEALCERLKKYNYDAKKAFAEEFRKPKSDGSDGPIVKKVKIMEKQTLGVMVNNGDGVASNGDMVRIDIFKEDGKYYFVPIYVSDTIKQQLPNKACVANKNYNEWKEMKEENFIFSLYSRDLVIFKHKKGANAKTSLGDKIIVNEQPMYYIKAGISNAAITLESHDRSFEVVNLGIQSLEYIKKLQVDVLGNITEVKKEKRMRFPGMEGYYGVSESICV